MWDVGSRLIDVLMCKAYIWMVYSKRVNLVDNNASGGPRRLPTISVWGHAMVTLIITISFLIGAILSVRWRVFVLIPTIVISMLGVAIVGGAGNFQFWNLIFVIILTGTAIQLGYFVGLLANWGATSEICGLESDTSISDMARRPPHQTADERGPILVHAPPEFALLQSLPEQQRTRAVRVKMFAQSARSVHNT
jgi:hypothetical protein